jgi:hypothetical protein
MLGFEPKASPFFADGELGGTSISRGVIVGLPRSSHTSPLAAGSHGCVAFRPYATWEAFASALNGPIFVLK